MLITLIAIISIVGVFQVLSHSQIKSNRKMIKDMMLTIQEQQHINKTLSKQVKVLTDQVHYLIRENILIKKRLRIKDNIIQHASHYKKGG